MIFWSVCLCCERRRDAQRLTNSAVSEANDIADGVERTPIGFQDELVVPWATLIRDRRQKDETASLHLFCAALAACELLDETKHPHKCQIHLHGGSFAIPTSFERCSPSDYVPSRYERGGGNRMYEGCVLLRKKDAQYQSTVATERTEDLFVVPRSRSLVLERSCGIQISSQDVRHGESETRFVTEFKIFIEQAWLQYSNAVGRAHAGPNTSTSSTGGIAATGMVGSLIVSDDTDLTMILVSNTAVHGHNRVHVLNDTVHVIDEAVHRLQRTGMNGKDIAMTYAFAGCDFTPSFYGIAHETFLYALIANKVHISPVCRNAECEEDFFERFMCYVFLYSRGKQVICTAEVGRQRVRAVMGNSTDDKATQRQLKKLQDTMFISQHAEGSKGWREDVRNFVSDAASSANELFSPLPHIMLQARRAFFIVNTYRGGASNENLSAERVGGLGVQFGYSPEGRVTVEDPQSVQLLEKFKSTSISSCGCKGNCSSMRCSCKRAGQKFVGCKCNEVVCCNRVGVVANSEQCNREDHNISQLGTPASKIDLQDNPNYCVDSEDEADRSSDSQPLSLQEIEQRSSPSLHGLDAELEDVIDLL